MGLLLAKNRYIAYNLKHVRRVGDIKDVNGNPVCEELLRHILEAEWKGNPYAHPDFNIYRLIRQCPNALIRLEWENKYYFNC